VTTGILSAAANDPVDLCFWQAQQDFIPIQPVHQAFLVKALLSPAGIDVHYPALENSCQGSFCAAPRLKVGRFPVI